MGQLEAKLHRPFVRAETTNEQKITASRSIQCCVPLAHNLSLFIIFVRMGIRSSGFVLGMNSVSRNAVVRARLDPA